MVAPALPAPTVPSHPTHSGRKAEGKGLQIRKADRREKRFAQLIAEGRTQADAYFAISGAKKRETCQVQGHRWCLRPPVVAEIARQRAALTEETAMTRAEKRNVLARVARGEETPPSVVVSAVAVDNRMTGDDEPFRKAAGEDLRVSFFVVRLDEPAAPAPGLPADPADSARNVTPAPGGEA